jgi:hypothetical protein
MKRFDVLDHNSCYLQAIRGMPGSTPKASTLVSVEFVKEVFNATNE